MFVGATGPVPLDDVANWWEYRPGAYWKRPGGKGTTINGRDNHPVTHVALEDVEAYAGWAGKEIPTEAEWERAARGGLEGTAFAWGDEHFPDGKCMANTWQGEFPWQNLKLDGYERTSPVKSFPRTDTASTTSRETCGSGRATGTRPSPESSRPLPAARPIHRWRTRHGPGAELPGRAVPSQGDQGRLASLRSELLLALPARGAASADDRHVDLPSRIPLHHSRVIEVRVRVPRLSLQCVVVEVQNVGLMPPRESSAGPGLDRIRADLPRLSR